ncbi:uncharacterized protein VDAG_07162 [Verticillium dahliae VdLs.17]|uniref:Uncharacterized protein n=1 Tax=Verticillium dahliae (strain VdLs.17 / ATCC MYA-4575 / FGSC 10137) TaxID=498257 RepID=G2X9W7_VERDV|nr:uncharacterized protein VDAG_07162 [Verticillium dahliae VdLs.17]EGY15998.1 hypothetical protein VDAG_07162 [Verticillium dahliae VdLs.17]KAH6699423.1 hypothetical protein EV126DRAFT_42624 [Verticillium dahliae]
MNHVHLDPPRQLGRCFVLVMGRVLHRDDRAMSTTRRLEVVGVLRRPKGPLAPSHPLGCERERFAALIATVRRRVHGISNAGHGFSNSPAAPDSLSDTCFAIFVLAVYWE